MNDFCVFDSIPLDHLMPGRRYVIERTNNIPIAGCFAGFRSRGRGCQMRLIVLLEGGECESIRAGSIESIKLCER